MSAVIDVDELAMLGDGLRHTVDSQCWTATCAGSLPWVVERIMAARNAEVRRAAGEQIAQAIEGSVEAHRAAGNRPGVAALSPLPTLVREVTQ